jgi:hypothetical protein
MSFIWAWFKHSIPWIIVGVLLFTAGYWTGKGERPAAVSEVVRVIDPPLKGDYALPQLPWRPVPRLLFVETSRTDTVTIVREIKVPVAYDRFRLIPDNYIHVDRRSVHIQAFNPETGQFEIDRITVPQKRRKFSAYLDAGYFIRHQFDASLGAQIRFNRFAVNASAGMILPTTEPFARIGIRYYI